LTRYPLLALAFGFALAFALPACGDDGTTSGPRCGDNVCSSTEDATTCPRDCSFECVPDTVSCDGNSVVTCSEDGLHEDVEACESGEICEDGACVPN